MNERDKKLLSLMTDYDASEVGSVKRVELGGELDKLGSKSINTESDFWRIVFMYNKQLEK